MPELKLAACSGANPNAAAGARDGFVSLYRLGGDVTNAEEVVKSSAAPAPSFLAWAQGHSTLYVASEIAKGDGQVTALGIREGQFAAANFRPTGGNGAVHLCLDRQGRYLSVANYQGDDTSGPVSVAVFGLRADGAIGAISGSAVHRGHGPDRGRQSRPHCHSVMFSPDNRMLAAVDLGTDSLYFYRFDASRGSISLATQLRLPPGTGPRHSVFHPTKPLLYLTGELNSSLATIAIDTVSAHAEIIASTDATGRETEQRNYPSGIAITPDGHYLLVANRGADTIAVFWIDPHTGIARLRSETDCGGRFPRAIRFDPSARYLAVANQQSDTISIFGWDFSTGALSDRPLSAIDIPTPLDMVFVD